MSVILYGRSLGVWKSQWGECALRVRERQNDSDTGSGSDDYCLEQV